MLECNGHGSFPCSSKAVCLFACPDIGIIGKLLADLGCTTREVGRDSTSPSNADKSFTTVLVGDSMVKQIQGRRLGREVGHRVVVKSFPGATTNDMKHYLMPTVDKKPQQIILHVGTNDLREHSPTVVAENIVDLAKKIEMESNAEVILSELVSRSDNVSNDAVKAVNKRLIRYCNQNDWRMIKHQNIDRNCLNKSGLHLNEKGNNIFFRNFVNALATQ